MHGTRPPEQTAEAHPLLLQGLVGVAAACLTCGAGAHSPDGPDLAGCAGPAGVIQEFEGEGQGFTAVADLAGCTGPAGEI
eukprot:53394-Pelagomonas_calceolata.AAC.3